MGNRRATLRPHPPRFQQAIGRRLTRTADDLLAVAERLLVIDDGAHDGAFLRRAVSTAYYALFHAVAANAADLLVGAIDDDRQSWVRIYRALNHGSAKAVCIAVSKDRSCGPQIGECAKTFIILQEARIDSDYDPHYPIDRLEARYAVAAAREATVLLAAATEADRRRFAVQLLFHKR